jgi:hypothetical protein
MSILYSVYNLFLDSHLNANGTPRTNLLTLFFRSWKYRIAGNLGICLTENEKKIERFKNLYRGERCFVIGNGPSLNKIDLTLLKNEITFGVNAIYTNYEKMNFLPNFYVVEDVFVAEDRKDEINSLKGPQKFYGNYLKYCFNEDEDVHWLNVRFRYDEYKNFPFFSTNALRSIWVGGTVSYISLQLAYYMGFSKIYMIGFDHEYKIPSSAKVHGNEILSMNDDVNHFNKDYFGKGKRWHDPKVDRMEKSYLKARTIFEKDGRKIYNATPGGKLEVFERIDYNTLFKQLYDESIRSDK